MPLGLKERGCGISHKGDIAVYVTVVIGTCRVPSHPSLSVTPPSMVM